MESEEKEEGRKGEKTEAVVGRKEEERKKEITKKKNPSSYLACDLSSSRIASTMSLM